MPSLLDVRQLAGAVQDMRAGEPILFEQLFRLAGFGVRVVDADEAHVRGAVLRHRRRDITAQPAADEVLFGDDNAPGFARRLLDSS